MFKPDFEYNAAEAELRKIASERRRDLKKLGYVFETYKESNENFCRYRIINRPFVAENQDYGSDDFRADICQSYNDSLFYDDTFAEDNYNESSKRKKMCDD